MSNLSRRGFIGSAAMAGVLGAIRARRRPATRAFRTTCPTSCSPARSCRPSSSSWRSPKGKVIGGSFGKEATVKQLPISKGIAGVSMRLEPGAMRELHWHATAAEWAFVIEGRVRTTVIDPQGQLRDQRLRARRRLVLPPRPRPHAPVPGRRADATSS